MSPTTLFIAVISVALNASAQVALRKTMLAIGTPGSAGFPSYVLSLAFNPWFVGGMSCYVVSLGLWLVVLSRSEVSLAYPLLSIGYVITASIGYFYLGEAVGPTRIAGIALICIGIVVISRSA